MQLPKDALCEYAHYGKRNEVAQLVQRDWSSYFPFFVRKAKASNFPVNNNTVQDIKSNGIKIRNEIISNKSCTKELKIRLNLF